MFLAVHNAKTSFHAGFGRESSATLANALEKRSRRDVCVYVPYSLLVNYDSMKSQTEAEVQHVQSHRAKDTISREWRAGQDGMGVRQATENFGAAAPD